MPAVLTDVEIANLVALAREARERAYAPYSKYTVGAALLTASGEVFTGCNVENAVYPAALCAERVAVTKAVSEGHREFVAIAVATRNAGSPCGICRQVMYEFAPDLHVILVDDEDIRAEYTLRDLLPDGFGPADLTDGG
ncbi:MAG TPA: cytidine deaminase [Aggregatilineales bacterium]|jgi:cytidine deaminase|nr:cytidine deaminase [Aggregatilineales bacterium]